MKSRKKARAGLGLVLGVAAIGLCVGMLAMNQGCRDVASTNVQVGAGASDTGKLRCKKVDVVNKDGVVVVRISADEDGKGYMTVYSAKGEEVAKVPAY